MRHTVSLGDALNIELSALNRRGWCFLQFLWWPFVGNRLKSLIHAPSVFIFRHICIHASHNAFTNYKINILAWHSFKWRLLYMWVSQRTIRPTREPFHVRRITHAQTHSQTRHTPRPYRHKYEVTKKQVRSQYKASNEPFKIKCPSSGNALDKCQKMWRFKWQNIPMQKSNFYLKFLIKLDYLVILAQCLELWTV